MKTGIITDEVSQDLSAALKLAKDYRLDAVEIRSVEEKNPFQMTQEDFRKIRAQADEAGLAVCCVASPFFKCDFFDESAIAAHMEGLRRAIQGAQIMGAHLIRGFAFWRAEGTAFAQIAERFHPVTELLEREDMTMVLESEPSVNTGNMSQLAQLLAIIHHPRIRALYDPGNEICDPAAPPPHLEGYEQLRPWIAHVHIKDMARTQDGYAPACIGKGDVDFDSIFARLRADGYSGYATLETHWRIGAQMEDALMVRPQGGGFSAGGEAASRICLDVLHRKYGFGA